MYLPEEDRKLIEVCYTPAQFELYKEAFDIVVVVDVLRATSAMTTAMHYGVEKIIPVASIEEAKEYQAQGFIVGAERDGAVVDGFDFGNSPYVYIERDMQGKTVVMTTTNGTKAIQLASSANTVVIGCLNNLQVLCDWLIKQNKNTLVLASGWKDKVNLEDTICGGAIAKILIASGQFMAKEDSTVAAKFLFESAEQNLWKFLRASSHRKRLAHLKIQKDVIYCLKLNTVPCIPILKDGALVKLNE